MKWFNIWGEEKTPYLLTEWKFHICFFSHSTSQGGDNSNKRYICKSSQKFGLDGFLTDQNTNFVQNWPAFFYDILQCNAGNLTSIVQFYWLLSSGRKPVMPSCCPSECPLGAQVHCNVYKLHRVKHNLCWIF